MDKINHFQKELDKLGARGRFISITHLKKLEREANEVKENRFYGKKVYEKFLDNYYDFSSLYKNTEIKSLCIVATPSQQNIIKFEYEDSYINVEVPPTYVDRKKVLNDIKSITSHLFSKFGYKTFPIILPKKSMAVHSGLAKYGKNNLVYVEGMGSYHRLTAFASDIPCDIGEWYDLSQLETCNSCGACEKNCPTKAINNENFLIDTDKCITFYNEQPEPFPDWIDLSWHNSLIGCLKCQKICPHNKIYKQPNEIVTIFNKEETKLIGKQIPFRQLPKDLQEKLIILCLDIYYDKLSRNLNVLYKNK